MTYCFRIRFVLGNRVVISGATNELRLGAGGGEDVALRAPMPDQTIGDTKRLVLVGKGYGSESDAHSAGVRWSRALQRGFARMNIGADFGKRAPASGISDWFQAQLGGRVLNDVHGLMTFECDPWPRFFGMTADLSTGRPVEMVLGAIEKAIQLPSTWFDREETAYDLYAASFFVPVDDARFTMLMMALETLIEQDPRSEAAQTHVDQMIAATRSAELSRDEIESIVGSLKYLRLESIGQAGRRLVSRLGDRQYAGVAALKFFTTTYELRSRLVHGWHPRPTRAEVNARVAGLEMLVSDLLSGELLDAYTPG